ncbi:MAG: extracellular solute-binding protein [Thaumarchaeota archaeon]|nr:extracellular solute-binding protein [Nitrososphaerota archaeon]
MIDKASLAVAVVAILVSAGSIAYTSSVIGGVSSQIDAAKKDLSGQITSQFGQVNSKISPLESSVNTVKGEQTAIRSLVDQRIGGLEKSLQEAQQRLAQAEKQAQQSQAELQALQAERALEEAAKKEKPPLIYGVIDAPDFASTVWPRFRESYPWAPAEGKYIEGFGPLRSRFVSEYNANAPTADIIWQSIAASVAELTNYLTVWPDMKYKDLYQDAMTFPNKQQPFLYVTHLLPGVIVYNKNIVTDADAPKGWMTLADSKWKNKIVMQDIRSGSGASKVFGDLQPVLGQQKWDELMKGMNANNPLYTQSSTEAFVKVVAGEFPIGIALLNDVIRQPAGSPIKVAWPTTDPKSIPLGDATTMSISKKAANPNFAKLFLTWLLSPTGQRAIAETGRSPALLTLDHPISVGKTLPAGISIMPANEDYIKNPKKWLDLMATYVK